MSLGAILLIILILVLVGALPTWGHSRTTEPTLRPSAEPDLRGVRAVLHEPKPVLGAGCLERVQIARVACVVHGHHGARARRHGSGNSRRVEAQRRPSSTSQKTGRAPARTITLAVAGQVSGVVITSSPSASPMPSARSARYIAAVQEETASAMGASA